MPLCKKKKSIIVGRSVYSPHSIALYCNPIILYYPESTSCSVRNELLRIEIPSGACATWVTVLISVIGHILIRKKNIFCFFNKRTRGISSSFISMLLSFMLVRCEARTILRMKNDTRRQEDHLREVYQTMKYVVLRSILDLGGFREIYIQFALLLSG